MENAAVIAYKAGTTEEGQAQTVIKQNGSIGYYSSLAFNKDYLYAAVGSSNQCLARNDFTESVMLYGLYRYSDGQRVRLNVGFPFYVTDSTGQKIEGWADAWGAFLMDGSSLNDGTTVTRINPDTGATDTLTAHVSNARMDKMTTAILNPADLKGLEFGCWADTPELCEDANQNPYKVRFNSNGELEAFATISFSQTGVQETPLSPPRKLTSSSTSSTTTVNLYSLGGYDFSQYTVQVGSSGTNSNSTILKQTYSSLSLNDPSLQSGLTLYCWTGCVKGGGGGYYPDYDPTNPNTPAATYVAQVSNNKLTLKDKSNNQPVTGSSSNPVYLYLTALQANPFVYSGSEGSQIDTYFFSSGDSYTQTIAFTDSSGNLVTFDKPIELDYTHSQQNDRNNSATYANRTFPLVYDGYSLMGIPFNLNGYFPLAAFSLKDGVSLTDKDGNTYVVKGLDVMQMPNSKSEATCTGAGLSIPTGLTLPTASILKPVTATWADKPNITGKPKVIDGVIQ